MLINHKKTPSSSGDAEKASAASAMTAIGTSGRGKQDLFHFIKVCSLAPMSWPATGARGVLANRGSVLALVSRGTMLVFPGP